ncbi:HPP family protein [Halorientalis brevis]|uniref:HPP family protein n=1 Tax=Halorientalis brevis TaxID=1126241 RepID=A0ABD6C6E6_9EURY|nr:CBS domain-containing protein [Halorientalis brevis]
MLTARDIMESEVETVAPDEDVADVLTRLARAEFNGYPVVEDGESRSDSETSSGEGTDSREGELVGIVTQGDLVDLFQPSDRTLWLPVGLPPFLESQTYAIDLSWDELDVGIDLARNANKPISTVMTTDVVTVAPDDTIDHALDLLCDERDINRLPVVEDGAVVGIIAREDMLRALRDERQQR